MSNFAPRDSKVIQDWYNHPQYCTPKQEGQGRYIMIDMHMRMHQCSSGNELRRIHELNPEKWLTGPMWMPLSQEDYDRIKAREDHFIDNF